MTSDGISTAAADAAASTNAQAASPVILPGRRRGSVTRLDHGVLIVQSRASQRRIPVAAIERVEVKGPKGRRLVVVLTAPQASDQESLTVYSRSAPAVLAFAHTLRQSLPVRDEAQPRPDGALLMTRAAVAKPVIDRRRAVLRCSVSLYMLAAATMLIAGLSGAVEWYAALACWLIGAVAVPLRHGVRAGWEMTRETWRLRTCGVLVEGRKLYSGTYEFTDADGRTRQLTDTYESAEQVRILYDPTAAGQVAQVGRRTAGTLAFALIVFLLSLAMTVALAAIGVAGPLAALDVLPVGLF
ncbi:hypothetical protein AB0I66_00960 [Streptomyces sp. NPDC050439]|uniref:hypothetical protein n=1 Tax=unclassified Streptomyces TaxID=2593676 RepID=UPI003435518B